MPPLLVCLDDAVQKTLVFLELYDLIREEFGALPDEWYDAETRVKLTAVPPECQKALERLSWYVRELASGKVDPATVISADIRLALYQAVEAEEILRTLCWSLLQLPHFFEFIDSHDSHESLTDSMRKWDEGTFDELKKTRTELLKFLALTLNLSDRSKTP